MSKQPRITTFTRKAISGCCPKCRAVVITGLDDDQCAFTASVDPTPITWAGELDAVYNHSRRTYCLIGSKLQLRSHLNTQSACTFPTFAAHDCANPTPDGWHDQQRIEKNRPKEIHDLPLF